jgi:predicted CopG family antitoxin
MTKIKTDFESYPHRGIRVSDEVWDKLKTAKDKSGKTWTNYFKELLKEKK